MSETLSAGEIARELGCSRASVYKLCKAGKVPGAVKSPRNLEANRPQGEWRIPASSVEAIRSRIQKPRIIKAASTERGAAAKVLWTLRELARSPGGLASTDLARRLENEYGGDVSLKTVRGYVRLLQDEEFEIEEKHTSGGPVHYRLLFSPLLHEMISATEAASRISRDGGAYKSFRILRQTIAVAAKSGEIPGARKMAGRWLVPWPLEGWEGGEKPRRGRKSDRPPKPRRPHKTRVVSRERLDELTRRSPHERTVDLAREFGVSQSYVSARRKFEQERLHEEG